MLDYSIFFERGRRPVQLLQGSGFFIHGAPSRGKTSLAFQAAINTVLTGVGRVLVLCREQALSRKTPSPFVNLSSLSSEMLTRIEFVYANSWTEAAVEVLELQKTLVATNTASQNEHEGFAVPPSLLIVDDDEFESAAAGGGGGGGEEGTMRAAAKCLSLIENTCDWLRRTGRSMTYVIVSNDTSSATADCTGRLPLPLGAFPIVNMWVGRSGTVQATPIAGDTSVIEPVLIAWDNGLKLVGEH